MKQILFSCLSAFLIASSVTAQTSGLTTYCNPIDIDYRYGWEQAGRGISYRSGADPVIVLHRGEYYLFVTISGGWWHSKDLLHWDFVMPDKWPVDDNCAPAALSVRDTLYLFQSTFGERPIFCTTTPETGRLGFFNQRMPPIPGIPGPWDPDIFYDDSTGRWFMYWGSSNFYPLSGIELDHAHGLVYKGAPVELLSLHPDIHGWERFGQDHRDTIRPYIEGAWMTRHEGRYYLQYAAPGTEYNVYANGTYVGDSPLGPFTYAPYNPVAYKPGGFMAGAGHGCTFQDVFGNYWNMGTPWVGVNGNFERRIAMVPAGFDRDGQMFASTRFGDFPQLLPAGKWTHPDSLFAGWMLLSYHKPVKATSERDSFYASYLTDENPRTFWVAQRNVPGEGVTVDLGGVYDVRAVQVNFADYKSGLLYNDSTVHTQFVVSSSEDGVRWHPIADLRRERRDRPNAFIELPGPERSRFIRYEHIYVGAANLAISDIRVFGNAHGPAPAAPRGLAVHREPDQRNARVTWDRVPGAVGYNVRWGIRPDKLYQTYQLFADQGEQLDLRALTLGQEYFLAVETFDENGVSPMSATVECP